MTPSITRGQFLSRGAKGGATLMVAGVALDQFADTAAAALPTGDTAFVRLLVGAELLASNFYSQAISASVAGDDVTKYMKIAAFNEQQHYASIAGILSGEGVTPAVATDINFSYPSGTFASEKSIIAFARDLETTIVGAYAGAVGSIQTTSLSTGLAEILACEAQHLSYFSAVSGRKAFSLSFPPALTTEAASNAFAAYTA